MKGGLAALVFTMKLMKDLRDQGFQLPGDIIFSAVVFEEAAEMFGMEYLCKTTLPQKGLNFDLCYLAEPTGGHVNLGHRGKVEVVVETHGKTAHSSQPWRGINALEKMVPVLDRIFNHMIRDLPYHPELGQCSMTITNIICKPGTLSIVPDYCEVSIDRRYVCRQPRLWPDRRRRLRRWTVVFLWPGHRAPPAAGQAPDPDLRQ